MTSKQEDLVRFRKETDRKDKSENIGDIVKKQHNRIMPKDEKYYSLYSFSAYDENHQKPIITSGSEINSAKYKVPNESILISKLNPRIKRVWRVKEAEENAICSTEFIVLKPRGEVPLDYLYAILNEPSFREYLTKLTTGTSGSHQRVKQADILNYEIPRFTQQEKEILAEIYGTIEKKIIVNQEISNILSNMGQTIFTNWFVDFAPYDEFKDSELGRIPVNFEIKTISEFADITLGNSPKSDYYNETQTGLPFFQGSKNFGLRYPQVEKWCTKEKKIGQEDDVLISIRAPVGELNIALEKCVIGRGVTGLSMKGYSNEFLFHLLKSKKPAWEKYKSGTTFNSVNKTDIQEFPVALPPSEEIEKFNLMVGSIEKKIKSNFIETKILAEIRDALLPKLMTGEIRISEMNVNAIMGVNEG